MPLDATYVRALRFPWLTRFYDRLIQATLKEEAFKRRLIEQADLRPGQRVLDVGCGTGTLTVMLQQSEPSAEVVGLDGDSETLAIARKPRNEPLALRRKPRPPQRKVESPPVPPSETPPPEEPPAP